MAFVVAVATGSPRPAGLNDRTGAMPLELLVQLVFKVLLDLLDLLQLDPAVELVLAVC